MPHHGESGSGLSATEAPDGGHSQGPLREAAGRKGLEQITWVSGPVAVSPGPVRVTSNCPRAGPCPMSWQAKYEITYASGRSPTH